MKIEQIKELVHKLREYFGVYSSIEIKVDCHRINTGPTVQYHLYIEEKELCNYDSIDELVRHAENLMNPLPDSGIEGEL